MTDAKPITSQVDFVIQGRLLHMAEAAWDEMMAEDGTRDGEIKAIFDALVLAHAIGVQDGTRAIYDRLVTPGRVG